MAAIYLFLLIIKIMLKINISLEPIADNKKFAITPSDLKLSDDDWQKLSAKEQLEIIKKYVDNLPDQPYWGVLNFYDF